jgi:hypothetical protein
MQARTLFALFALALMLQVVTARHFHVKESDVHNQPSHDFIGALTKEMTEFARKLDILGKFCANGLRTGNYQCPDVHELVRKPGVLR